MDPSSGRLVGQESTIYGAFKAGDFGEHAPNTTLSSFRIVRGEQIQRELAKSILYNQLWSDMPDKRIVSTAKPLVATED